MNSFQQETLRQSRSSFDMAQKFYKLIYFSAAASSTIGFIAAIVILCGQGNIAKLTAFINILPTLTCHQVLKTGAKQLEDASDRLRK